MIKNKIKLEIAIVICYTYYVIPKGENMNTLLGTFIDFINVYVNNLLSRFQSVNMIVGVCFAILGVVFAVMAKRITRIIRKRNDVDDNDKAVVTFKAIGLVFMLVAFLFLVLPLFA